MADLTFILIPFLFAFAIVYGALDVSGVFKSRRINALLGLTLAFFAVSSQEVLNIIHAYLPYAAIVFIVVFFLSFIFSPFKEDKKEKDFTLIIVIIALAFLFMAGAGYGTIQNMFPSYTVDLENFMYGGGLILLIMLIYAAYKRGKE